MAPWRRANASAASPTVAAPRVNCTASLYLVRSRRGKVQQLFVPRSWEQRVRQAVADYQQLERLLEEVSEREWKRLQDRREE